MGQQQLLLIILVSVLVGIATVVAINTFQSASESSNIDAVRNDLVMIKSNAQAYFRKPATLGGGGNSFDGFTFEKIGFPADEMTPDGLHARTPNGVFHVWRANSDELGIYGEPLTEIDAVVDITSLVSDSDYFSISITSDTLVWLNTPN